MNKIILQAIISQPIVLSTTTDGEAYTWVWYSSYNDIGRLELCIGEPMYGNRALWAVQTLRQGLMVIVTGQIINYYDKWSGIYKYKLKSENIELIN